jgi:hypothetical protein
VWLIAAAVAALLLGGGVIVANLLRSPPEPSPPREGPPLLVPPRPEPPPENRVAVAAVLRDQAKQACAARRWAECETKLDAAAEKDPEGNSAADVLELRRVLEQKTAHDH